MMRGLHVSYVYIVLGVQICFLYGAGMLNSERLIQDYGFIDPVSFLNTCGCLFGCRGLG